MSSLLQNFQVSFPERVLHLQRTVISQPEGLSQPGAACIPDSQREYPTTQGLHHSREVNAPNQRTKVGLNRETMPSVITPNNGDAFAASVAAVQLSQSVIHSQCRSCPEEAARHQSRAGRPCKKPDQLNSFSPGVMGAPVRFRSPRRCTQRRQWLRDVEGPEGDLWSSDKLLQAHGPDLNGNGLYTEMLRRRACPASQEYAPPQFNGRDSRNGFFTGIEGGCPTLGGDHTRNIQPPGNSPGTEGGAAGFSGDFTHYTGHSDGRLNGNCNRHYKGNLNGYVTPDIGDGKISEEDLRSAALLCASQRLQQRPRRQHAREVLWGQGLALHSWHSWPSKLKKEGQTSLPSVCHSAQGKVEPERFHKTPKDDLEEVYKANRNHQSGGELNNYLEAAIEDAMSELNKLTGSRDVKAQKPKRRKISR
uniref:uncharacterized protein n=1 Tax=Centroberyx gerrardi TaxID=166262 RepID=UPI003AAD151D